MYSKAVQVKTKTCKGEGDRPSTLIPWTEYRLNWIVLAEQQMQGGAVVFIKEKNYQPI